MLRPHQLDESIAKEIALNIENAEYFRDARDWYIHKYIYPVTERSYFVVVTTIAIITSIIAIVLMVQFLPLTRKIPVAVDVDDLTKSYAHISSIGKKEDEPNQAFVQYLSFKYVDAREHFKFDDLERSLNYISTFSSDEIFDKYKSYVSIRNSESPVLRFRRHTTREITIYPSSYSANKLKVDPETGRGFYEVTLRFKATETGIATQISQDYIATLQLNYSNITFDKEKKEFLPLDFVVTKYEVTPVNG